MYRSYGFLALSNVLDHIANFSDDNNKEVVDEEVSDIFSKAFSIMISSWASLSSTGDQELRFFELCLLRLCNRTLALGMKSQSLDDKVNTVLTIWESISQGTRDTAILSESLNIYSSTSKKRTDRNDFYFKEFNKILRKMSSYSFQSLTTAVKGIAECIKAQPNLALEVMSLYRLLSNKYFYFLLFTSVYSFQFVV